MLLPVIASVLAMTALGCAADDGSSSLATRRLRKEPPAEGTVEEHDLTDLDGANSVDPGNPNADTRPNAPGTVGASAPQFALAISQNTPVVNLGEAIDLDVTVEPKNGFAGNVDVVVTGLPAGATAATVVAAPGKPAKLTIKADITSAPTTANTSSPVVITGKSGGLQATANANFKIAPRVTITIPINVDALRAAGTVYRDQYGTAFGSNQESLQTQTGNGIVVSVFNADSKNHVIHGPGAANGFAHGDANNPIKPNAFEMSGAAVRTRTLNPGVNTSAYLHDGQQGAGAAFRVKVVAAL